MINGKLYENTAMVGISVSKSFHLEKTYTKVQVNCRNKSYNFNNVNGLIIINKQA